MKRHHSNVPCFCQLCKGSLVSRYIRRKHKLHYIKLQTVAVNPPTNNIVQTVSPVSTDSVKKILSTTCKIVIVNMYIIIGLHEQQH